MSRKIPLADGEASRTACARAVLRTGVGRTHNTRMSQQVRGQIVDRMRHLAAETGIAVVTVPARNTSKALPAVPDTSQAP